MPTGVALSGLLLLTQLPFAPFLFLNVVNLLPERADAQVINPCPFGPSGTIVSDPGQMQQMFNANQILHQSFPDGSENLYNTTACNLPDGFRYDVYQIPFPTGDPLRYAGQQLIFSAPPQPLPPGGLIHLNGARTGCQQQFDTGVGQSGPHILIAGNEEMQGPLCQDNAACVNIQAPDVVQPGQQFSGSVTFQNNGSMVWMTNGNPNYVYRAGTQNPQDNHDWGFGRIELPGSISPVQNGTFTFNATAPTTPGQRTLAIQMVRDGIHWFGAVCSKTITIQAPQIDNANCTITSAIPQALTPGQKFTITFNVQNTGTTTWKAGSFGLPQTYQLMSTEPSIDNTILGESTNRIVLLHDIAPQGSDTLRLNATAPAASSNSYNLAYQMGRERSASDPGGRFGQLCRMSFTVQAPQADLTIRKDGPQSIVVGNTADYTLTVTNNGPATAENVQAIDNFPISEGFQFLKDQSPGCVHDVARVVCTIGTVTTARPAVVHVFFRIPAPQTCTEHTVFNSASVFSSTANSNTGNNDSQKVPTLLQCPPPPPTADVSVTKTGPATVRQGAVITYTLTARNDGPAIATTVAVQDVIPQGLRFLPSDSDSRCFQHDGSVVCDSMTLRDAESIPLTVAFQTDGIACGSVVRNSATIATSAREDNLDNNRSQTVMTTVQCLPPIFKIAKTDHRDTIKPGEHDTYEITVTNTSGFAASATVQDQFPSNQLTFQSASNGGRFDGSTITWNNLSFQSGEKKTLTVQAQAHGDLRDGAVITNTVQVVNGPTDTDATTVSVPPPPPPQTADVSVTKTGPATVRQGAVITYTLTARNDGPAIATTVAVQDVIPQGLRFLPSDSDSRCFQHDGSVVCDSMTLRDAESIPLTVAFQTDGIACGSVVRNSATIATSAREDNLDNNRSQTVMTTVQCPPPPPPPTADLGIQKLALRSSVQPGDIIAYRLTVSNAGPDAAANVSIVDPIPSDLSFLDSLGDAGSTGVDGPLPFLLPPSTCTQQGRRVVCNVATIASGGNRTVLLRFKVSDSAQCNGSIQNAASVSASTPDPNLGNNQSDTVSTRVDCPPLQTADLGIQKVPFSFTVRPGDFLTYRLTVTNDGPSSAANVSATDSIPKDLTFIDVLTDQDHPGLYGPLPSPLPFLTCSRRDSTIVCTTPHLPPGTSRSAFLHFRVSPAASCNQVIRNMASVSSTTEDRNLRNNQTQASVFVECPPPTFTIKKTDNRDTIRPGENDTYRIMVTNTSPFAATTIITDFFPTQLLDFQSASDNGTLHGGRIVWNNLSFTPGETKTLTVQAQAHGDLSDGTVITNEAQVDLDGTATDTTTVVVPPKFGCILVNKEADNPDGNPLPTVPQFTFRLENGQHTQNNASGVATFANVPAGQHTVSEILPLEWTQQQINPAGGIVTVVPGPACASVAIRNRQNPIGNPTFSITKTDNKRTANPGDFVTYTITVTNTSPVDASNVSVVDQLPAGQLTFLFSSDNGQLNGQTVTWSGLSIPKQSTRMLTVFAQVNAGLSGGTSITNTAQVVGGPTTTDTITVIGGQQNGCISIVKEGFTATGANVSILPQFTFQLENGQTIQNDSTGQATFQNVSLGTHTVTEQSLSGWNQIFVTPSNGVVNVTAGACVGVTFKNQKIAVGTPTFAITKTVNHATAAPGDALVYTITVTNTSNVTGAATVNDTLPSGLTFVNASENGSANGQTVTWNTLVIPANSTKVITLTALANSNLINGTVITNIATVTGGATATDTTTIQTSTSGNVSLTINDYPDPVRPCDTLNYAINVTNFSSQQNLTVTQILSNRTSFTFASDGGAERNGTITWNTLSVPTGSTKTLTVSVRVSCGARDGDILRTTVTAGNASAEATTRVIEDFRNNRNISLDIRDAPDPVRACDTLDYTLTVRNDNGDNDVTVRAVLDPQTSFLSASGNGYERSRGQVEWRNVFLSRSDLTTLRLTVRIDCGARDGDTLRLHGQADGATADETTRVINDRNVLVPVPIAPVVGTISVTKQADRSNAAPNDEIAYTITVTNTSQASLTGMQVIDSFTPGQVQLFDVPQVSGGQAVWTIDSLAPNQVRTIVYRARVSGSARNGDVLHNSVTVQGGNLPTPGFASSDVRVVSSLPQTGGGQFSDPLSLARLFSHSPADQAAASIPLILWSTIAAIGSVSGGLLGRRFFF